MAENVTDVFKIPREPLIHNRYRHILDQVIQLEPVALEKIKVDILRRLCG